MATCVHVRQSDVCTAECLNALDHLGFLFTNHVNDLSSYLGALLQHNVLNNIINPKSQVFVYTLVSIHIEQW